MTKQEAFDEINQIQDYYIDELINLINSPDYAMMKSIDFTSATGTGKTKMMSKLINRFPDYYFIVTTLSKGQLHLQIRDSLQKDCNQDNFYVYGSADYKINSKLEAEDIIGRIPSGAKCIWLRDEGHIKTNRFDELLIDVCYKVVNFSATNTHDDIRCDFTQTMMLRTVNQTNGTPEDAIKKLLEIKDIHTSVSGYNPCAIFRCVGGDDELYNMIVQLCDKYHLKYIDITEDSFLMSELCEDDNEYDVIINKFKIVEGIDIRRAHVLYMDNQPANNATTIQVIGRCRRNALLYRNDIDILAPENKSLLEATRECYVYYNVKSMKIDSDTNGELYYAFCNEVSCESLKVGSKIHVDDGQLPNGLTVIELKGYTGDYVIKSDKTTGFNVVSPLTKFYNTVEKHCNEYLYAHIWENPQPFDNYFKIRTQDVLLYPPHVDDDYYNYNNMGICKAANSVPVYHIEKNQVFYDYHLDIPVDKKILLAFDKTMLKYDVPYIKRKLSSAQIEKRLEHFIKHNKVVFDKKTCLRYLATCKRKTEKPFSDFYQDVLRIGAYTIESVDDSTYKRITAKSLMCEDALSYLKYRCLKSYDFHYSIYSKVESVLNLLIALNIDDSDCESIITIISFVFDDMNYRYDSGLNGEISSFSDIATYASNHYLFEPLIIKVKYDLPVTVELAHIQRYFHELDSLLMRFHFVIKESDVENIAVLIRNEIEATYEKLKQHIVERVEIDCSDLFKKATRAEYDDIKNHVYQITTRITADDLDKSIKYRHDRIINDRESAIIGVDMMKPVKADNSLIWIESSSVSSKIDNYNKLNSFLSKRYEAELSDGKNQCFNGKNDFKLDKKCNSVLGYCVEYYSKYIVYGESYLHNYIKAALKEAKTDVVTPQLIVRACMLKYRAMMVRSFGSGVSKILQTMSITTLIQEKYQYFVKLVVALGTQTAKYVLAELYPNGNAIDNIDPDLSIRHIKGLADYITEDTILDVKVRNNIDDKCIRQVLAYHYLSTKRSDLHIKRVIVYDAVSDKAVVINITPENQK